MEGVPGTVGGALVMNAGAFGCDIGTLAREVWTIEQGLGLVRHPASDFRFEYRRSDVSEKGLAAGCVLELSPVDPEDLRSRHEAIRSRRRASQPWREATAGSVFKNPPGAAAGKILESLGFRGRVRGGAELSSTHANFLVNRGGATFEDAFGLCEEARSAAERAGVRLEYEVALWRALEARGTAMASEGFR